MEHRAKAVLQNCCKPMELCKTKAQNGFTTSNWRGYLAHTPWNTLLLPHVGGGGARWAIFLCNQRNIGRRAARRQRTKNPPTLVVGHIA